MTKENKELMLIFENEETRKFLCNDVFPELMEVLPRSKVLNATFAKEQVRKRAKTYALKTIENLLEEVNPIKEEITKLFEHTIISEITEDILTAYTYYFCKIEQMRKPVNIFTSKLSVVYVGIDMFEIV